MAFQQSKHAFVLLSYLLLQQCSQLMFVQHSLPLTGRTFSQLVPVKLWTGSDLLLLFVDKTETSRSSGPVSQVFLPPLMSLVSFYRQTLHPISPYSARATTCLVWCSCGLSFLRLKYNTVMTGLEKKIVVCTGATSTNSLMTTSDDKILMWFQSSFVKRSSYTCVAWLKSISKTSTASFFLFRQPFVEIIK